MLKAALRIGFYILLIVFGLVIGLGIQNFWSGLFNAPVTITGTTILESIKAMSQLTTTRYTFSNIVTSERELPGILAALYGDRLVMVAVGYVDAGIDLSKITEENIRRGDGVLTIQLPPPQLQNCFLDEKASYVVSRDTGIFARPAPNLDDQSRRYAVNNFRDMALRGDMGEGGGILKDVQLQARDAMQNFVAGILKDDTMRVEVNIPDPDPNAPLPSSCS